MSGFKSILKPVNKILKPFKKLGGDIMGTTAARQQAEAVRKQTEEQQRQYEQDMQSAQNENMLNSQQDLSNVASVSAGGTAADSDAMLGAATKKNRKQLISSTLGI